MPVEDTFTGHVGQVKTRIPDEDTYPETIIGFHHQCGGINNTVNG